MEIADEVAHRALTYVASVTDAGYRLARRDFGAYVNGPGRQSSSIAALLPLILGEQESVLDWLVRLRWLTDGEGGVDITPLGRAVLKALDARELTSGPNVLLLSDDDTPLPYAAVVERISAAGEALLVDRYLDLESIMSVVSLTKVNRILIGPQTKLVALATVFERLPDDERPEVRVSDRIHDRYVIPPSGPIDMLGTSLNGVGRRLSAMTPIHPPASDAIRMAHEEVWSEATPLTEAAKARGKPDD